MAKRPKVTAKKIIKYILAKKGENVLLFDLRKITDMADFFILCSGLSDVQVRAISDSVLEGCKKDKIPVYHVEGYDSPSWVLIDLVDIVVHIFTPDARKYYQLERLWGDAKIEKYGVEGEEAVK